MMNQSEPVPAAQPDEPVATTFRRSPWWMVTVAVLGVAAVVLGGLFVMADRDRRDQRGQIAELTERTEELRRQQEALTARLSEAEQNLAAERARFAAVEPCLRQLADPKPLMPLSAEEVDRILREATRNLPRPDRSGALITSIEVPAKDLVPACKEVEKQLR